MTPHELPPYPPSSHTGPPVGTSESISWREVIPSAHQCRDDLISNAKDPAAINNLITNMSLYYW